MSSTLTGARFLTVSLTVQLYPGWDITVWRDSMMVRGWRHLPQEERLREWPLSLFPYEAS